VLAVTVLLVVAVRVRVREMPLERDEGEYAFAGQLILQGVPPYKEVYNMKLPGTYAAYALIMAVLGQNPAGIHLGVMLLNVASIVLVFLIGRRLLDEMTGAAAAICFALMSLSPSVLGLAGHATHFVIAFALAGIFVLLKALERLETTRGDQMGTSAFRFLLSAVLVSGLCFGLAFLMKQHGLFFGVFGFVYLAWTLWRPAKPDEMEPHSAFGTPRPPLGTRAKLLALAAFCTGAALPYVLTCLVLGCSGVFSRFWFWTVSYAGKYASSVTFEQGQQLLKTMVNVVSGPNLPLWLLPWAGALITWWGVRRSTRDRRQKGRTEGFDIPALRRANAPPLPAPEFFLMALLLCSMAATSVGFYYREHYFILLLPVLACLSGVAVGRAFRLIRYDLSIEVLLALPILLLFATGVGASLVGNGAAWFSATPEQVVRETYGTSLFNDAMKVSEYIKQETAGNPKSNGQDLPAGETHRIAVIGSEPEIYFYAKRRSATGYIYVYPLMEAQPFALKMQQEMGAEIERARPEYVVFVEDKYSWLTRPDSHQAIFDWWKNYWVANLDLVKTLTVEGEQQGEAGKEARTKSTVLILKRKENTRNQKAALGTGTISP
jgi:hypothetical protein